MQHHSSVEVKPVGRAISFRGLRLRGRRFAGLAGWDGKPLHPSLAAVPLGAAVAAAIFDVGSTLSSSRELYRAATLVLLVGQGFTALAVLTGWWERRRLTWPGSQVRGSVNAHGWMMLGFGAVTFVDLGLRRSVYPNSGHTPALALALTLLVLALAVLGGTLGGALVFEDGLAVEGRADERPEHASEQSPGTAIGRD